MFSYFRVRKHLVSLIREQSVDFIVIPFVTPWDLFFQFSTKSQVKFVRLIHDSKRHPGDLWPRNSMINWSCKKSHKIITLSSHVSKELQHITSDPIQVPHPWVFAEDFNEFRLEVNDISSKGTLPYFLVTGRTGKAYKGVINAINWWNKSGRYSFPEHELLIRNSSKSGISVSSIERLKVIDDWIDDFGFLSEISGADVILCLYSEASQSGIVTASLYVGTPFLTSAAGGLAEEVHDLSGHVIQRCDSGDITEAIKRIRDSFKPVSNLTLLKRELDFDLGIKSAISG
jgi:glycosyltransferase involved in cell wall biosynthesis